MKVAVGLAMVALLIAGVAAERGCDGGYDIAVRVIPQPDPARPCIVKGAFRGCGLRRLLMSRSEFQLMPGKGVPSEISGRDGNSSFQVRAGLSNDNQSVWYAATVERNARVVASKSAVVALKR